MTQKSVTVFALPAVHSFACLLPCLCPPGPLCPACSAARPVSSMRKVSSGRQTGSPDDASPGRRTGSQRLPTRAAASPCPSCWPCHDVRPMSQDQAWACSCNISKEDVSASKCTLLYLQVCHASWSEICCHAYPKPDQQDDQQHLTCQHSCLPLASQAATHSSRSTRSPNDSMVLERRAPPSEA